MGKLGKSVLKERHSESPPKLTKAEIKELQEYQERMKELAEQRKAENEREQVEVTKEGVPSGNVEGKENEYEEVAPVVSPEQIKLPKRIP